MKVTQNEKLVFENIVHMCYDDCGAELEMLTASTGINANSLRGVLANLVKKGLIYVNVDDRPGTRWGEVNEVTLYCVSEDEGCGWYLCDSIEWDVCQNWINALEVK
jgi:hypothetical protein